MASELTRLKNVGAVTATWLVEVGIDTETALRTVGAAAAFRRIRERHPDQVTVLLLYALEGALTDTDWRAIPQPVKDKLRAEANV